MSVWLTVIQFAGISAWIKQKCDGFDWNANFPWKTECIKKSSYLREKQLCAFAWSFSSCLVLRQSVSQRFHRRLVLLLLLQVLWCWCCVQCTQSHIHNTYLGVDDTARTHSFYIRRFPLTHLPTLPIKNRTLAIVNTKRNNTCTALSFFRGFV